MPTFMLSDTNKVYFDYCRNIKVVNGTWDSFQPEMIVNHHMSYVRTNQQLIRKINTFSHGEEQRKDGKNTKEIWNEWYNNIWLKWTPEMENLHVNPDHTGSFSKTIDSKKSKYLLSEMQKPPQ